MISIWKHFFMKLRKIQCKEYKLSEYKQKPNTRNSQKHVYNMIFLEYIGNKGACPPHKAKCPLPFTNICRQPKNKIEVLLENHVSIPQVASLKKPLRLLHSMWQQWLSETVRTVLYCPSVCLLKSLCVNKIYNTHVINTSVFYLRHSSVRMT